MRNLKRRMTKTFCEVNGLLPSSSFFFFFLTVIVLKYSITQFSPKINSQGMEKIHQVIVYVTSKFEWTLDDIRIEKIISASIWIGSSSTRC